MSRMRVAVFEVDGNRFIVPGWWYDLEGGIGSPDGTEVIMTAMIFRVTVCRSDKTEWLELEADENGKSDLPTVLYRLCSRALAHGAIDVLLISGPLFDASNPAADAEDTAMV